MIFFFFFKQKTAYEIKECDWSSDVCSSDLSLGFQVDPFVIDVHTRAGRQLGLTRKEFVEEGAQIIPGSKKYYVELFENIYKQI